MGTKQDHAVTTANDVVAFAQTLETILDQARSLSARITAQDYITVWQSLSTAPWNADGTLGTADSTPNNVHPITVGGINLAANDLIGVVYDINDFITFMTNTDSGSNPAAKNRLGDLEKVVV